MRWISFDKFARDILQIDEEIMQTVGQKSLFFWITSRKSDVAGADGTATLDAWEVLDLALLTETYFEKLGIELQLADSGRLGPIRTVGDLFLLASELVSFEATFD